MKILEPTQIITAFHPAIFLAGPATGTYDWQNVAISEFKQLAKRYNSTDFVIANPRTYQQNDNFDISAQTEWEYYYLREASFSGCIMFWLAKETKKIPNRGYARTTRFELGEFLAKAEADDDINLRIGIESGFEGEEYIKEKIGLMGYDKTVHNDLKNLCVDVFENIIF